MNENLAYQQQMSNPCMPTYQQPYPYAPAYNQVVPPSQVVPDTVPPPIPKKTHVPSDKRTKIHTIFLFNLAFNLTYDQLMKFCKQYGDVSTLIFPLLRPGMAFCTFYDLRAAEKAVVEMKGQMLNNRPVKTNFAFKPPPHSKRDPKEICSTILVKSSKGENSLITFEDIQNFMGAFGDLRDAERVELPSDSDEQGEKQYSKGQWIVKYYDLRSAQKCVETHTIQYKDEELTLEFILDDDLGDDDEDPAPPPTFGRRNRYQPPPPTPIPPSQPQMPYPYPSPQYPSAQYPYPYPYSQGPPPYGYPTQYQPQPPTQQPSNQMPPHGMPYQPASIPPSYPQAPAQPPAPQYQPPNQMPPPAPAPTYPPTQPASSIYPPSTTTAPPPSQPPLPISNPYSESPLPNESLSNTNTLNQPQSSDFLGNTSHFLVDFNSNSTNNNSSSYEAFDNQQSQPKSQDIFSQMGLPNSSQTTHFNNIFDNDSNSSYNQNSNDNGLRSGFLNSV